MYDPVDVDERKRMLASPGTLQQPVLVGRAPRWFYIGILALGAIALLLLGTGGFASDEPEGSARAPIAAGPTLGAAPTGAVVVELDGSAPVDSTRSEPDFRERFTKREHMVPMRDGVRLYVAVYTPKASALAAAPPPPMPLLMSRTPYSCAPYGEDQFPAGQSRGELKNYFEEGWIFVRCDVRGRYASEGTFVQMTPHIDQKLSSSDIDESSDTYDTIEWLVNNVP
eukprot:SAG11_NODE_11845_length_735_cov_1.207547_1_plen_225_part_10